VAVISIANCKSGALKALRGVNNWMQEGDGPEDKLVPLVHQRTNILSSVFMSGIREYPYVSCIDGSNSLAHYSLRGLALFSH
jgi:hypothetical protein